MSGSGHAGQCTAARFAEGDHVQISHKSFLLCHRHCQHLLLADVVVTPI